MHCEHPTLVIIIVIIAIPIIFFSVRNISQNIKEIKKIKSDKMKSDRGK